VYKLALVPIQIANFGAMPSSDNDEAQMSASESSASYSLQQQQIQSSYVRQPQPPFQILPPSWLRKKPLWVVMREISNEQNGQQQIQRHLSLIDLISVGVGGTIGSGIFVLAGFIARNYSGPATPISFAISGIAAAFSGVCYGM